MARVHPDTPRQISLWVERISSSEGRLTVEGQVWLGPVAAGDCFTSASDGTTGEPVRLDVETITAPPERQEVGRTPRVIAVLTGDPGSGVRPGLVLLGEGRGQPEVGNVRAHGEGIGG
jgi:hypothetical protein